MSTELCFLQFCPAGFLEYINYAMVTSEVCALLQQSQYKVVLWVGDDKFFEANRKMQTSLNSRFPFTFLSWSVLSKGLCNNGFLRINLAVTARSSLTVTCLRSTARVSPLWHLSLNKRYLIRVVNPLVRGWVRNLLALWYHQISLSRCCAYMCARVCKNVQVFSEEEKASFWGIHPSVII